MTTKSLRFESLPSLAISEGATTPNPGVSGVWVWSSTLSKPMHWNGTKWTSVQNNITVSATAPSSPQTGDIWLDIS